MLANESKSNLVYAHKRLITLMRLKVVIRKSLFEINRQSWQGNR